MEIKELAEQLLKKKVISISPITGGMMNKSYLVETSLGKYVLYVPTEQANEMVDRVLEKADQETCYKLGITSKNIYFDVNSGIKINEYLDGSSIDKINEVDYKKVANMLKVMHSSKTLSSKEYGPFNRFIAYENEANTFTDIFDKEYKSIRDLVFANKGYLESIEKVFSHNDFQRSNVVKSNDEYYVIDFEFTGNNDPIYDIACFANGIVEDGEKLLEAYYTTPSVEEYRRFYLWRMFISMQWRNVAIIKHYRGEGKAHGFNFLDVARHFMDIADICYKKLDV